MAANRIFLSHSSKDKPFVRQLVERLRLIGLDPWLDECEIKPGASLIGEIELGLESCRYLFAVMSTNSVRSRWVTEEIRSIMLRQLKTGQIEVIPIRIDDCDVPTLLSDKKYIDFRGWRDTTCFRTAFDRMVEAFGWIRSVKCQKTGIQFVYIPEGVFLYGKNGSKTYLDGYWIGKHVATQSNMLPFLNTKDQYGRLYIDQMPELRRRIAEGLPNYPAQYVNICVALNFAHWAGFRLPTPEEWEKAARGVDGRAYPWGDEWDESRCNCRKDLDADSVAPVEAYPEGKSPYGCQQMAGNVHEVTSHVISENIETGERQYLAKGGCYFDSEPSQFLTYKYYSASDVGSYPHYGYRFVVDDVNRDQFA